MKKKGWIFPTIKGIEWFSDKKTWEVQYDLKMWVDREYNNNITFISEAVSEPSVYLREKWLRCIKIKDRSPTKIRLTSIYYSVMPYARYHMLFYLQMPDGRIIHDPCPST